MDCAGGYEFSSVVMILIVLIGYRLPWLVLVTEHGGGAGLSDCVPCSTLQYVER